MTASSRDPAEHIGTELSWSDLDLESETVGQVREIERWTDARAYPSRSGYRALFVGPAGTGKTVAASLLGKELDRQVLRIDLSRVVSKFIGETEKNLARLFERAEDGDWILFFDEADDLFGKRDAVRDSHDRYTEEEVTQLLARIESYPGLVILAASRGDVAGAASRCVDTTIRFAVPRQ